MVSTSRNSLAYVALVTYTEVTGIWAWQCHLLFLLISFFASPVLRWLGLPVTILDLRFTCSSYSNCYSEGWVIVPILTPQKKKPKNKRRGCCKLCFILNACEIIAQKIWQKDCLIKKSQKEKNSFQNNSQTIILKSKLYYLNKKGILKVV